MHRRTVLSLVAAVSVAAIALVATPAVASPHVEIPSVQGPTLMAQESSCPTGLRALVPDPASLEAAGVAALLPAGADALTKKSLLKVPLLQKAISAGYRWTTRLGCKVTDVTAATSPNWSGYRWTGLDPDHAPTYYSGASMDWIVPTAESGVITTTRRTSIWPGVGSGNQTYDQLIQAGTETVAGPAGYQGTYAWVEAYPYEPEVQITSNPVNAGDYMSVAVQVDAVGHAWFYICDETSSTCTESTQTFPFGGSNGIIAQQAEWILERSSVGNYAELGNFGTESFSSAGGQEVQPGTGLVDGFTLSNTSSGNRDSEPLRMLSCNGAQYLTSNPSSVSDTGFFTITWQHYGSVESPC